jgi:hypothetical protein
MQQDLQSARKRSDDTAKKSGLWKQVQSWDSRLSVTKGLTIVTLLTGFFGGYFQYLNSYEEKVGEQAKADMASATATFIEISNAFAEVQMLQENMLANFAIAANETTDAGTRQMETKAAAAFFADYSKARTALRQNAAVFARKAEIYIDWPSDLSRDPAAPRTLDQDPLTQTVLKDYNIDCDADANLPQFKGAIYDGRDRGAPNEDLCAPTLGDTPKAYVDLCARRLGNSAVDPLKKIVNINWWSAKHHVLVLNHCSEVLHAKLGATEAWASGSDIGKDRKQELLKQQDASREKLGVQARRLDAFMTLTMSQLERIRVRYRPSGFVCHVPLVRDAIGLFSSQCMPIRTAIRDEG